MSLGAAAHEASARVFLLAFGAWGLTVQFIWPGVHVCICHPDQFGIGLLGLPMFWQLGLWFDSVALPVAGPVRALCVLPLWFGDACCLVFVVRFGADCTN